MTPMAFNDGIYFNNNTSSGKFDTDIIICYWSNGWNSYSPMPASDLASKGFKLVNTHGDYYWVLGKSDWQCSPTKAAGFDYTAFQGGKISNPAGAMFCIWGDYPGAETEASVISKTAATIKAFGNVLPETKPGSTTPVFKVVGDVPNGGTLTMGSALTLRVPEGMTAIWTASPEGIVELTAPVATRSAAVTANSVNVTPLKAGDVTIAATNPDDPTQTATFALTVSDPDAPKTETVTLTVGQTITSTQDGVNNSGADKIDKSNYNANIASVSVTGQDGSPATVSYQAKYVKYSTLAGNNTDWAKTDYFYQVDGNYYPVYAYYSSNYIIFTYYYVGYSVDGGATVTPVINGESNNSITVYTKSGTEAVPASTTITFKGLAVGETSIKVGNVTYLIEVVDKAPDNALTGDLTLEYWITNNKVYEGTTASTPQSKTISTSAAGASTDEGIALSTLAPNSAYGFFDGTKTVYYWMTVRLDSAHKQTIEAGVDQTAVGTTLTHVRYHAGAWQYKTLDGTWTYFESGDQLVAYYLQKTDVTKDVETYVKDWGYGTNTTTPDTSSGKGQVALTVAVVYPDGTVQPTENNMYSQATTIFNYWDNRDIGIVSPKVNENYTISKMTVTDGVRKSNTTANVWYTSDTITWDKVELESGEKWYNETVVWQKSDGTTPMVNGAAKNIKWSAKNTAKLVLIYLEPIQKDTNLNVVYVDRDGNVEIQRMQVAMKYNQGDPAPTYFTHLYNNGARIAYPDKTDWPGKTKTEPDYLPDSAYVVNAGGVNQTFSKDITTNVGIADKYKSGLYSYDGAEISTDGKTLTLYFALDNSKLDNWYVLDFGLPIEIPVSDLVKNFDSVTAVSVKGTQLSDTPVTTDHGKLTYNAANKVITYTPTKTWTGSSAASVSFNLQYANNEQVKKVIGVIPASNILYEENFLTPDADSEWTRGTSSAPTDPQQTQRVVDENGSDIHVFGFDSVYDNKLGETGVWKADNLDSSKLTKPLTTSFYGNGFDLIGNCGPNTGRVLMIISPADGSKIGARIIDVDTRYTGDYLYQVPLAHVEFNNDAAYNVKIWASGLDKTTAGTLRTATASLMDTYSAADDALLQSLVQSYGLSMSDVEHVTMSNVIPASGAADVSLYGMPSAAALTAEPQANVEHQQGTHVEIDSFRVYRTTDKNDDIAGKYPVAEQGIVYNNILDVVKGQIVAFTEGNSNTTIQITNYEAAGGPQNEIYIGQSQAISFRVEGATEIQVSLRAVQGATSWADTTTGGTPTPISTNTEMYYTVHADTNGVFTITNRGSGLLAIGNVKLPSGAKTTSASEIDEDALRASLCAALGLSAEQPQAFQPKTFTARATTLPMLRNKRVSVLITISNDVSYVTVNGVKYTPSRYYASWQKTRLIQFGETLGKYESKTYTIIAYDANGVASAPITVNG